MNNVKQKLKFLFKNSNTPTSKIDDNNSNNHISQTQLDIVFVI